MFTIEFSKHACKEHFESAVKTLIAHGFTQEEAVEFLESTYYAVAEEYGD